MIYTVSSIREFRSCKRRYQHKYVNLVRPALEGKARLVGTATHDGLDGFWLGDEGKQPNFANDFWGTDAGRIEQARVGAMLDAYRERWGSDRSEWRAVEAERVFEFKLGGFIVQGKLDKLAWRGPVLHLVEHKTTSDDIATLGDDYWQRIALDLQLAIYQEYVEVEFGERPSVIYDVIKKPGGAPKLKSKIAKRKSETDEEYEARKAAERETLDEFRARLTAEMLAEPDTYLVRRIVHRTREQQAGLIEEALLTIEEMARTKIYERNDSACVSPYGACAYLGVCTGVEQLDSPRFVTLGDPHPELDGQTKKEDADGSSPDSPGLSAECPI